MLLASRDIARGKALIDCGVASHHKLVKPGLPPALRALMCRMHRSAE